MKWLVAFGRFWYDFVVGDSVVLAVGGIGVVILGALLVSAGVASFAQLLLPLAVVTTLAISLRWPH